MLRVNLRTRVNNEAIRRETRNGREKIIVPSATLPDNIVMNDMLYPAEEIAKAYPTLEGTAAPFGHPVVNGMYMSATHPESINAFWVGAHNENVRQEGGRVLLDKVVDVETAGQTERGRRLLQAINEEEPINTSTGLFLEPVPAGKDADGYSRIATNMVFDHDAILLDTEGAATPEQGVGMFVNEQVEVFNFNLEDMANEDVEYAAMSLVEAIDRKDRMSRANSLKDRIMTFLRETMNGGDPTNKDDDYSVNHEEGVAPMKLEDQVKALEQKVADMAANQQAFLDSLNEKIAEAAKGQVETVTNQVNALQEKLDAVDAAKRTALVETVVNAGFMKQETANKMDLDELEELAANAKPGTAAGIFAGNAHQGQGDDAGISDELPGAAEGGK